MHPQLHLLLLGRVLEQELLLPEHVLVGVHRAPLEGRVGLRDVGGDADRDLRVLSRCCAAHAARLPAGLGDAPDVLVLLTWAGRS